MAWTDTDKHSRVRKVCEPSKDGSGNWYWALVIPNDGTVCDGYADTRDEALGRLEANYDNWLEMQ